MTLQVYITTPSQPFPDREVEELILPANSGQLGVLKDHAPLITSLDVGPILLRNKGEWSPIAVTGGFALVRQNEIIVLANEAFLPENIDSEEASRNYQKAQTHYQEVEKEEERLEATFSLKKARLLYQLSKGDDARFTNL